MQKIVVNKGFGGFFVPNEVNEKIGCGTFPSDPAIRTNPLLIEWVEKHSNEDYVETKTFDGKVWKERNSLTIVEIPDDVDWEIEEYDGAEWVSEKHRRWYP